MVTSALAGLVRDDERTRAEHPRYGTPIRLEYWSAALHQGPAAARNMLGLPAVYDPTPYFFSDQYDLGMEYRGWAPAFDQIVFRGEPSSGEFICFWLDHRKVVAAMNANVWDQGDGTEALLAAGTPVDLARLADPTSTSPPWRYHRAERSLRPAAQDRAASPGGETSSRP